jgi:DNA ligase (NAD+)
MNPRIQELQEKIDKADGAYYSTGQSVVEDALYDQWREELAQLNPKDVRITRVGACIQETILQKRKHQIPMGSQSKVTNEEEYRKWIAGAGDSKIYHASYKMDGGSFSFEYQDGRMISGISRGDGFEGEDITANAARFQGVPPVCKLPDGTPFNGFIRGEVVLLDEDWEQVDPEKLTNPRNCAVGIARRKNGAESEFLTVYAFRVFDSEGEPLGSTEDESSIIMKKMGFNAAPYFVGNAEEVWHWFQKAQTERPTLPYWIDGIVVKLNNLSEQLSLGESDNRPKGQVAVKFEAEGAISILRRVDIGVGHTGAIVPTGTFDPVQIGGTTVTCATLCNWDNIRELNIGVGDKIRVIKAGDIIPRVMEVVERAADSTSIPEPTECPVCKGPVVRRSNVSGEESAILYCLNPGCSAKVYGKIERFLRSVNILGIGGNLIRTMIRDLQVQDAADIYKLHTRRDALAALKLNGKVRLGEKRADSCLAEVEKARKLTLSQFLGSLGIFGLGKRRIALVQKAIPGEMETIDDWLSGKLVKLSKAAGVPNMAERMQKDLLAQRSLIEKFLANGLEIVKPEPNVQPKPEAFIICITGALSQPKAHYWKLISEAGHAGTDDFSKTVTHLVAADPNGTSSKLQKARKLGIPILSESQLLELLKSKL